MRQRGSWAGMKYRNRLFDPAKHCTRATNTKPWVVLVIRDSWAEAIVFGTCLDLKRNDKGFVSNGKKVS